MALKRIGGATVASLITWTSTTDTACAQGGSAVFDISSVSPAVNGTATTHPSGAGADYEHADNFPIEGGDGIHCECKAKLSFWLASKTPHSGSASVDNEGEIYGTFAKNGAPNGIASVSLKTEKRKFTGSCNPTTGLITPSDSVVSASSGSISTGYQTTSERYRLEVKFVNLKVTPASGSAASFVLTGQLKAVMQRYNSDNVEWETLGGTTTTPFSITMSSHLHQ